MPTPIIKVSGIGPKTAQYLAENNITTAEALVDAGINVLVEAPGFNQARAAAVMLAASVASSGVEDMPAPAPATILYAPEVEKGKKKKGKKKDKKKDKKKKDKKSDKKKDKKKSKKKDKKGKKK